MKRHTGSLSGRPAAAAGSIQSQSEAIELIVVTAATLVIVAAWLLPAPLVLPSISIAALSFAGLVTLVAWRLKVSRNAYRLDAWDAAGIFALVGFGAGMLSEPQAVVQFFAGRYP